MIKHYIKFIHVNIKYYICDIELIFKRYNNDNNKQNKQKSGNDKSMEHLQRQVSLF